MEVPPSRRYSGGMSDVTRILAQIECGDRTASERLLPLVYEELRRLAAAKLSNESPGQTLQPTALVHEAYLRLVDVDHPQEWDGRGHFFAAAAEAMRRILIESARRRKSERAGGALARQPFSEDEVVAPSDDDRLLALDEALSQLSKERPDVARLVELRYFGGLTIEQAANVLKTSPRTANRYWVYAKAWLGRSID